jgi:hypothetical protein
MMPSPKFSSSTISKPTLKISDAKKKHLKLKKSEVTKASLSLCVNKYQAMKTYGRSGRIDPLILNLGTRWKIEE